MARTFWKETTVSINQVFPQEPSVTKLIVSLKQFDSVSLGKGQFVGASGNEVICEQIANTSVSLQEYAINHLHPSTTMRVPPCMMYNRRGREINREVAVASPDRPQLFEKGAQSPAIDHPREPKPTAHLIVLRLIVDRERGGGMFRNFLNLRMTMRISPTSGLDPGVAILMCRFSLEAAQTHKWSSRPRSRGRSSRIGGIGGTRRESERQRWQDIEMSIVVVVVVVVVAEGGGHDRRRRIIEVGSSNHQRAPAEGGGGGKFAFV